MSVKISKLIYTLGLICLAQVGFAQDDLLSSIDNGDKPKEYIKNAFKSSRVINGHSIEFIGKGVLDVRILHRFGLLNSGFSNLYGLDQATMRFGFDYGVLNNLTVGIGRSTFDKEWDAFVKYRPIQQSTGGSRPSPVSVVLVSGMTASTTPGIYPERNYYTNKLAYYHEIIVGRKFNEKFSAQLSSTLVHLNIVPLSTDPNNIYALGLGARYKLSKRTAFVVDYHYILRNLGENEENNNTAGSLFSTMKNPLSIGFDIETGGHVFQLHFSNCSGMNEKAFITKTTSSWGKGEIRFGFNLSRVFTVSKPKA